MKPVICLAVAMSFAADNVSALSCLRPDVARTFNQAADAEESYVILLGQFAFTPPRADPINPNDQQSAQVAATFDGRFLGADGFETAPTLDVTLNLDCLGPWCGSVPVGEDVLAFVEQTPDAFVLNVGPCYDVVLPASDENLQRVEACMRGDACTEADF